MNGRPARVNVGFLFEILIFAAILLLTAPPPPSLAQSRIWISAYYAGWMQGNEPPMLPAGSIDMGAVTHIIHFSLVPQADGTLDDVRLNVTASNAAEIVKAAHSTGKKVLISVGGTDTEPGFAGATDPIHRGAFIGRLLALVKEREYDGIDIDWEPLSDPNVAQYGAFITELKSAMQTADPGLLLTAAVAWQPQVFSNLQGKFDQINLMTYDLAGPWEGWVTWHNAPVYNGGFRFPSTGELLPSADDMVQSFLSAGVAASKLGIGIDFYGYLWKGGSGTSTGGATAPRQSWVTAPAVTTEPYSAIMDTYSPLGVTHWDNDAQAAYISIDNSGAANDTFISLDDENSCRAKIAYVRKERIGGAIIWELGGGWRPAAPVPDLLLQAVKSAAFPENSAAPVPVPVQEWRLAQNYPNPFNPETTIRIILPHASEITLRVYDLLGRQVAELWEGRREAGEHAFRFDGSALPSGAYFCRLTAGSGAFSATRVLMLVR